MLEAVFYRTSAGNEPVRDWIRDLGRDDRVVIGRDLRTVQIAFPVGMPVCSPLRGGLFEVRTSLPSKREARLIFFQHEQKLIIVHGFIKKTQKTPKNEIDLAEKRKNEHQSIPKSTPAKRGG